MFAKIIVKQAIFTYFSKMNYQNLKKYSTFTLKQVEEFWSKILGVKGPKSPNFGGKCIKKSVFSLLFGNLTPNVLKKNLELI